MRLYTHILFPTDGSESSQRALVHVRELARIFGCTITVLHAYSLPMNSANLAFLPPEIQAGVQTGVQQEGERILRDARRELQEEGFTVHTLNVSGSSKQAIVNAAQQHKCDLIVMGARGAGQLALSGTINHHGSTSSHVIHHTPGVPVLVVS